MKIVGHRGAEGYAPENTLSSFRCAIDIGCDFAELDVRLSRDGELIVIHDEDVGRTCNGTGLVKDMSLAELKRLDCGAGERIPTLQDVIDVCKGKIGLQIELKAPGTPERVSQSIERNGILDQVIVSSFDVSLLKEIKSINPLIPVLLLFDRMDESVWRNVEEIPLEYIGPKCTIIDQEMVDTAHGFGVDVYAFHVSDVETGLRLKEMGVDEIGTPFPKMFISLRNDS